ncbi:hypothetical protein B0T13DRAFT_507375 [Neurospora crassa]|nr:hypothetical protein B0T13DRAFT_507375 [Neurospora crassa]
MTRKPTTTTSNSTFTTTPSRLTLFWLLVSLPLVIWDTLYVLLRPHTMPGGALHYPLWAPYELYGRVDYVYGWKAWNERNGFTAAQGMMNAVETVMYLVYAWGVLGGGNGKGEGRRGATVLLVGFSAAVMTLSKTVLYWLNEYYSGFDNIGHNSTFDLILLWIIPNGAWLVFPSVMIYTLGSEIIDGLAGPSTTTDRSIKVE